MWDWQTYFIFGIALIWAVLFLRQYSCKPKMWVLVIIALLPLFFLHAFRDETVGTDLPRYAIHVEEGGWFVYNYGRPPLEIFSELLYFISHVFGGLHLYLFLSSLIEYVFLAIAIRELNKRGVDGTMTFVVIFSYMVLRSVSMVRNGMALSVALCAVVQLFDKEKKSKWKYWIFTFIALGFHNTAVLMVPIYFICRPLNRNASMYSLRMFLRIMAMVGIFIVMYIVGSSGFLGLFFRVAGDIYNDAHFEARDSWGIGNLAVRLPFLLLVLLSMRKMKKKGINYMPFLMMLLFDILISQLKYISQDLERLTMYSALSEMVLWGVLYSTYIQKRNIIGKVLFILVGIAYYSYYMYHYAILGSEGEGNGLMPYHTWFIFI